MRSPKATTQPTSQIFNRSTAKLLHRATYLMDKAVERILQEKVGIGLSQFLTLMQMSGKQQCQRELAGALGVTPAAISRQVANMVKRGMLEKLEHEHDRRFEFLVLTAKGKRLLDRATTALEKEFTGRYEHLTEADKQGIHEALSKLMHCYESESQTQPRTPD